jgi:hypothetical protein
MSGTRSRHRWPTDQPDRPEPLLIGAGDMTHDGGRAEWNNDSQIQEVGSRLEIS